MGRDNSLTTLGTAQFWLPHVTEDIDGLVCTQREIGSEKQPGEEERVKFRAVKYADEKTKVDK